MKKIISVGIIALLLLSCATKPGTSGGKAGQPEKPAVTLSIDVSDIELYYQMIDQAQADGVELDGQYLYDHYVSKGSAAVKFYYKRYADYLEQTNSPDDPIERFWEDFQKNVDFLAMNRGNMLKNRYLFTEEDLEPVRARLESFLDEDFSSTFYFTIGNATMAGTAIDSGIVIDISMIYSDDNDYSTFWLPEFVEYLSKKKGSDSLFLFVHELMHQLQAIYLKRDNIEDGSASNIGELLIVEGGGHFFADILLDEGYQATSFYKEQNKYYQANPQIMMEVLEARNDSDEENQLARKWFYNYGETLRPGEPPDMGYFLGSVIAQDYYDRAKDKKKAFIEIVRHWENADRILDSYEKNMK